MKKFLIVFGAIAVMFLMVSSATAVPQSSSETIMKNVNNNTQQVTMLEEKLEGLIERLVGITPNVQPKGIIDILLAIIQFIIDFINSIINFIVSIMEIGSVILALINAITTLIDVLNQFIEWLQGLFNPESAAVIQ